jgi:hypothetical protein
MAEVRIEGVVKAEKCKCCGHHELGISWTYKDKNGLQWPGYRQLKPKDKIILIVEENDVQEKRKGSSISKEIIGG